MRQINPVVTVYDDRLKVINELEVPARHLHEARVAANMWAQQWADKTGRGAYVVTPKSNPLTLQNKIVLGLAAAAGLYAVYYAFKGSTAAAPVVPATPTIVLQSGAQTASVTSAGIILALPAGATWIAGPYPGTSTPIAIPAPSITTSAPITWKSHDGVTQTTTLTLNPV